MEEEEERLSFPKRARRLSLPLFPLKLLRSFVVRPRTEERIQPSSPKKSLEGEKGEDGAAALFFSYIYAPADSKERGLVKSRAILSFFVCAIFFLLLSVSWRDASPTVRNRTRQRKRQPPLLWFLAVGIGEMDGMRTRISIERIPWKLKADSDPTCFFC